MATDMRKILIDEATVKLALEGIESMTSWEHPDDPAHPWTDCAKLLREALAEQPAQQEPVAIVEKVIKELEPLLAAKNQSWAQAEKMLFDLLKNTSEPQSTWVAVSDRLPLESDGEVLVRMRDGRCEIAWATYWHGASNAFSQWTFRDPDEDEAPTHWMHIPAIEAAHGIKENT